MNKTLSTFLRLSGDTGAFAAIPGEFVMFSCNRPAFDKEKKRGTRARQIKTLTHTRKRGRQLADLISARSSMCNYSQTASYNDE